MHNHIKSAKYIRNCFFLTLIISLLSPAALANDILLLKDNNFFEGEILKIKNCEVKFKASDGNKYYIPAEDIQKLIFEDTKSRVFKKYQTTIENEENPCLSGRLDAENLHGKAGRHVVLGILFGPFTVIGAAVSSPRPHNGKETMYLSKNKELFQDPMYLSCYTKKARSRNVIYSAAGWGSWILFALLAAG